MPQSDYEKELKELLKKQDEEMDQFPYLPGVLDAHAAEQRKLYKKHILEIIELKKKYVIEP